MKFHAKKDMTFRILIWVSVFLFLGLSVGLFIPIYHEAGLAASITFSFIFGIFAILILWLWYRTFYVVTNEHLMIHIGPFKRRVELNSITRIEKTNASLASIALSKERSEERRVGKKYKHDESQESEKTRNRDEGDC